MAETESYSSQLVQVGAVAELSFSGSNTVFELRIPDEEEANRYYRNPYDYLEKLLEQEGRPANEIHIVHTQTPYVEEAAPSLRSIVSSMPNGVWIADINK